MIVTLFPRLIFVLLLSSILVACGDELTSEDHLEKAKPLIQQGLHPAAIVELKSALQKDATNTHARALLGQSYFETGTYEDAEKELSRALSMGVEPGLVVPVLAQVLLGLGDYDRLDELALDNLDPQGRSTVQAAKALSMMYRDNMVVAEEITEAALNNEPPSAYALVAAARLSMQKGDFESTRTQLEEVFAKYPKYAPAWNLLGDIESAERRPGKAEQAYTKVIELSGNTFDALLNRAMMRIYRRNYQGATQDLIQLRGAYGGQAHFHPGANFAWGLVMLQTKQLDEAERYFHTASEFSDAYPQTFYYKAAISLEKGLVEQALTSVYQFLGLVPGSVVGSKLAAKIELSQQSYDKAEKLLLPVVAIRPFDIEALNLLASALLAQGKSGEGLELLGRVAELQPKSSEAKARLGAGFLAAGLDDLGVETLRKILEEDPSYEQADVLIVLNYLRQKEVENAIKSAQEYRDRNPESATSYDLLGRAFLAGNRKEEARTAFLKALEIRPGDPGAGISLADLALQEKNFELAREYYKKVLDKNPSHMQTLMKLASSFALEGREQDMLSSLQNTLSAYPRAMEPRLMMARYYIAGGHLEWALSLLDELSEEQKAHPDALVTQAGFELAAGRYNQALVTLGRLVEIYPDVSQHHYMLSKAYAGVGDIKQFSAELERTVELDPDHFYAKIALARLALLSNQKDKFEKHLAEVRQMAPENADVMKLEVILAQQKGDNASAARLLEAIFHKEPAAENAIALATHKHSVGDVNGAITELQRWVANHPNDIAVRQKLAEIYGSNNQLGGVVYQYRKILETEPDNVLALNNLAWHLRNQDPKESLEFALKATKLAPGSSLILDTLAIAQLKNNNLVEARRTINHALRISPNNPEIRLHAAQIMAAEGDIEGAIETLTSVLDERKKFPARAEAEALLAQLKSA
jgi:putative PEP-CTERM system TPR-repeat lipoprotein